MYCRKHDPRFPVINFCLRKTEPSLMVGLLPRTTGLHD